MVDDNEAMEQTNEYLTRRRVIQAASAGTTMFLAGCAGGGTGDGSGNGIVTSGTDDGSSNGTENGTETESGPVDATFVTFERNWMNEANLNPFANNNAAGPMWHLFPPLAMYSTSATFNPTSDQSKSKTYNEYPAIAASGWSFDGKEMSINLPDDWQWTSGDEVTSADLALRVRLLKYFDDPIWNYLSGVHEKDEKTVVLEFKNKYDQGLIQQTFFGISQAVNTPKTVNGEKTKFATVLEELQDASTQSAEDKALQSLVNFSWYPQDATFSGPFSVKNVTKSEMILERHDGFYDPVNFTTARMKTLDLGQTGSPSQALSTGKIDVSALPSPTVASSFPDSINVVAAKGTFGIGYGFNYNKPGGGLINNRNVRRAIAFVLSSENASKNSNPLKAGQLNGVGPYTGIVGASEWLSEDTLSKFDRYKPDKKKATSLLQGEGFTKEGGTWMTPDGEKFTLEVSTAPWHVWPALGQTVVGTLSDFGINTTLNALGSSDFATMMWGSGDFQTSMGVWGAAHPANAYTGIFGEGNVWHTPAEIEVPMPIGDPQGSLETINVRERTAQLAQLSGDKLRSETKTLAWAFNQTLPVIPLVTENGGLAYSTKGWNFPDQSDPIWGTPRAREAMFSGGLIDAN